MNLFDRLKKFVQDAVSLNTENTDSRSESPVGAVSAQNVAFEDVMSEESADRVERLERAPAAKKTSVFDIAAIEAEDDVNNSVPQLSKKLADAVMSRVPRRGTAHNPVHAHNHTHAHTTVAEPATVTVAAPTPVPTRAKSAKRVPAEKIYFDHASTTPIDSEVFRAMKPYFETDFYNPSSIYADGVRMKEAITEARKTVARLMNVQSEEIIFTSNGTESNNLALFGVVNAYTGKGRPHIVTSTIEHPSVLETCKALERAGVSVTYIEPTAHGVVDPQKIKAALKSNTVLVSIMSANNEIGTIQPMSAIGRIVREYRGENEYPYFHTDASQIANYLPIHIGQLGADLVTLDATKVYGPRGAGILCVRRVVNIDPIIWGGGQEGGLRSGTENTPAIVGAARALEIAQNTRDQEGERLVVLQDYLIGELRKRFLDIIIHGEEAVRLPNIVNMCMPGLDSEFAVIKLDQAGFLVSAASACQSNAEENYSATVAALPDVGEDCKRSSLRFSFGRSTTKAQVDALIEALERVLAQ